MDSKIIQLLAIMIGVSAVDHKSENGASFVVYVLCGTYFLIYGFLQAKIKRVKGTGYDTIVRASFISILGISALHAVFGDNTFSIFARTSLPFAMAFCAYSLFSRLNISELNSFLLPLLKISCVSVVFSLIYGLQTNEVGLDDIRYQVISPLSILLASISLGLIVYPGTRLDLIGFAQSAFLIISLIAVVSATRGLLLAFGAMAVAAPIISANGRINLIVRNLTQAALVCLGGIGLLSFFLPDSIDRVAGRLFSQQQYGFDPTSLTRVAEVKYQLNALFESPISLVFGSGLGAVYSWAGDYDGELRSFLSDADLFGSFSYVGHNFWVYSLYAGGIVVGCLLPYAFLLSIYHSLRLSLAEKTPLTEAHFISLVAALFWIGTIVSTLGANPFVTRAGGIAVGIFFGYVSASLRKKMEICAQPEYGRT